MNPHFDSRYQRYRVGQILKVRLQSHGQGGDAPSSTTEVRLVVKKLHKPWTLSCGLVVEVMGNANAGERAFLKLYDRRLAAQLRSDYKVKDWSEGLERDFVQYAQSGEADDFVRKLQREEDASDSGSNSDSEWTPVEDEAYLAHQCAKIFDAETRAYETLQESPSQPDFEPESRLVPRFLGAVSLVHKEWPIQISGTEQIAACTEIRGILLEYIDGFSLGEVDCYAPEAVWPDLVRQAVHLVHQAGARNILNKDVHPRNFLVTSKNGRDGMEYKVIMIDLGQSRVRGSHESEEEWGRSKCTQDEEGAVLAIMRLRLRRVGYALDLEHSQAFGEWAEREE